MKRLLLLAAFVLTPLAPATAAPTIAAMKNHRRVLIVASPAPNDARLIQQRRAIAGWAHGARDRDVSVVEVIGGRVHGSGDRSRLLRRQWRLPPGDFQAVLVSKDGHEVLRERRPIAAAQMQRTIDVMPMRRAGQR